MACVVTVIQYILLCRQTTVNFECLTKLKRQHRHLKVQQAFGSLRKFGKLAFLHASTLLVTFGPPTVCQALSLLYWDCYAAGLCKKCVMLMEISTPHHMMPFDVVNHIR